MDRYSVFERFAARVAVVGPLRGPRAAWGRLLTDAVGLARGVRWVLHDDGGDPDLAEHRAREIVLDGGYSAVVGHFNSQGARAALPHYGVAGLPCLLPLATEPGLASLADGLVLRWCATDDTQARVLLDALAAAGHTRVDVVTDGTAQMDAQAKHLLAAGGVRLLPRGAPPSRRRGAVIVVAAHHRAAAMARDLRAGGFRGQLAFTDDCAVPEFAQLAGAAADGALLAVHPDGAASRVHQAVTALAAALAADPSLTGPALVAAVKEHAPVRFTPAGELADDGWAVTRLSQPPALGVAA